MPAPLRLAVVIGHTAKSPGAYSPYLHEAEYSFNSRLAALMMAEEREGLEMAVFTRDGHGVAGAYAMAADWGCHATAELHFNAAGPNATGTETLHAPHSTRGALLAGHVQSKMVGALGLTDRGAHEPWQGRGMASLTALSVPAIITEPFFGSCEADAKRAAERTQELAKAIVQGAVEWWLQDQSVS